MNANKTWMLLGLGLTGLILSAEPAAARRGGDAKKNRVDERVDLTFAPDAPFTAREARLRVRRKMLTRQRLKIELSGAPSGRSLDVFFENSAGAMVDVGDLVERRAGIYKWRIRTKKGQALPFGVADVAELSGRAVEVRTAGGALVADGSMPAIAAAAGSAAKSAKLRSALNVDVLVADAVGADSATHAVEVSVRVRRKSGDREELKVEVEHAADGLDLELWLADATGALVNLGVLSTEPDGDDGTEYEISFRTDRAAGLPFGATSVADLAGRQAEVRTVAGDILAEGTVPALGSIAESDEDAAGSDDDDATGDDDAGSDDDDAADDDDTGSDDDDAADDDENDAGSDDDANATE